MIKQCQWAFPHHDGRRAAFRCIREEGHDGVHRGYNGRWNAETQFKTDAATQSNSTDSTRKDSGT